MIQSEGYSSSDGLVGKERRFPKNMAFKNILLVPYQVPLKFGLSEKSISLPWPSGLNNTAAEFATFFISDLCRYPPMSGVGVYCATVV